jgi:hypothetical protein
MELLHQMRRTLMKAHACQARAKWRQEDELFQYVLIGGLSAANNLAERSIRPRMVIRKISGRSRSAEGTKTRLGLASLFETGKYAGSIRWKNAAAA